VLAKHESGLTRAEIEKKAPGVAVNAGNIGPVFKDYVDNYPDSLYARRYVKPIKNAEEYEDEQVRWIITTAGKNAASKYKTLRKVTAEKIPPTVLDPVVKKFMALRTYGLELYTDDDLKEIRTACGDEFSELRRAKDFIDHRWKISG
jgi:hypothetical protein